MIRMMGARVLVQRIEERKAESEHIIIPDTIQEKPSKNGIVWAVGTLQQGGIEVGDLIIMKDFVGAPCPVVLPGDERTTECMIVNEDDILAVIEGV